MKQGQVISSRRSPRLRAAPAIAPTPNGAPPRIGTETLDLPLRMLDFLAGLPHPTPLTHIARTLSASKATVYRHLQMLLRHGFVRQDERTGHYGIGVKLIVLGEASRDQFGIVAVARDEMRRLRDKTGQAISICAMVDDSLVVLELIHGHTLVEFATRPGTRLDLHASAHGKVWLAFGTPDLLSRVLASPRKAWTPHTLTDGKALTKDVTTIRRRGWAVAPNEVVMGVNTLAAPVHDHRGALVGSIAIVGSTQFVPVKPSETQIADVTATAARISRVLGWKGAG